MAGSEGSPDLARDVRGFAVKLYTQEGNWDLVGNNIPVFFIQDAIKFPDLIHAAKPEPDRGFPQAATAHDTFWDFASLMPEATHMLLWTMSDRAIPRSFRFMEGFGIHTFRLVNAEGRSTYVKFHWKPKAGLQSVTWDEAVKINGADADFHRRDLWNAIEAGRFPEWELGVQLFDDEFADRFPFDVLDATKLIPEEDVPVRLIGRLVLDRNVNNFFAETEQVAFCTANVVPGIDFTNDPLLQGRNFSYLDTQLKRLGSPNFTHIPVNAPRCPVAHFQRDGHMTTTVPTGRVAYEPNSFGPAGGPRESAAGGFTTTTVAEQGNKRRVRPGAFADHYSQPRQFYISQNDTERNHIVDAFVFELSKVQDPSIRERMVAGLVNVGEDMAERIATGLGMALPAGLQPTVPPRDDLAPSLALSMLGRPPGTFAGRRVGALVTDGTDATVLAALRAALEAEGAELLLVAPTIGGVETSDGQRVAANEKLEGGPSVLFDAVAILASTQGAEVLARRPSAIQFVADAHAHAKFIGWVSGAAALLEAAGSSAERRDEGYVALDNGKAQSAAEQFVQACRSLRHWPRENTLN